VRSQVGPNNVGLTLARSENIAYCGHDDLWLPDHLERLLDTGAPFAHGSQLRVDPGEAPYAYPSDGWTYSPGDWLPPTSFFHLRKDAVRVGGWRHPVPGQWIDPEAELCRQLARRVGLPVHVPRITSEKLPAAMRRDVYRDRSCDEQAFWWARIQAAADSATFAAEAIGNTSLTPPSRYRASDAAPAVRGVLGFDALERRRLARITKGLDDGPRPLSNRAVARRLGTSRELGRRRER